jgi:hypothetical protein
MEGKREGMVNKEEEVSSYWLNLMKGEDGN